MDEAVICPSCGCAVTGKRVVVDTGEDVASAGFNLLGFFVPLAGLILFCTMVNKTPKKAKQIGIFSLVGFVINLILIVCAINL